MRKRGQGTSVDQLSELSGTPSVYRGYFILVPWYILDVDIALSAGTLVY